MKRVIIGMAVIALTACGPVATEPATSPVARVTPTPQPLLFAVLEANGTANAWTYNTAAIAGLDGHAVAKATFAPMPAPALGCIGAVIPQSAHVAAGKVFFADGKGVIRSLAPDGNVATVATFPLTSTQQMLSFAVSPDGSKVLGTVFTAGTNAAPCDGSPSTAQFAYDAYSATAGGPSSLLYHSSWNQPPNILALTGWDALGPIGTYPTVWATQGGGPGSTLGVKVRVDAATLKPGARFSDPEECQAWSSIAAGEFACLKNPVIQGTNHVSTGSIRRPDGTEAWTFSVVAVNAAFGAELSPDGHRVSACCLDVPPQFQYGVFTDGAPVKPLAVGFEARGWLDSSTLVGDHHPDPLAQPPFDLSYVALSSPGTVVSMGFKGLFVGTVRA